MKSSPEELAAATLRYKAAYADPVKRAAILARNKAWLNVNRKRARETAKKWKINNRIKSLSNRKEWRLKNKEKLNSQAREFYYRHRESCMARTKKWHDAHPEYKTAKYQKRYALEKKASINLKGIKAFMRKIKLESEFRCYYCMEKFPISVLHFDHIIPITKGGQHSVENLCTACQPCNQRKGSKLIQDWIRTGQQVFNL